MSQIDRTYTAYRPSARTAPTGPDLRLTDLVRRLMVTILVIHVITLVIHYSFTDPKAQRDVRLSWPGWLTHSRQFTHEVVTCQP